MYVCRFQNVVLRCPTPRLHCFLSSHWPSFRYHSFMAFLIPSIQFLFGLLRVLFCFGIHFNAIPSAILWTWPYVPCKLVLFNFFYNLFLKPAHTKSNFIRRLLLDGLRSETDVSVAVAYSLCLVARVVSFQKGLVRSVGKGACPACSCSFTTFYTSLFVC